jgi:hypothetical protein
MAQKTLTIAIGLLIGITCLIFFDVIKEQIKINIPRYPSYSCLIARSNNPNEIVPAVVYRLGKIDWSNRRYVIDENSNLGLPFYLSWSDRWVKIDCEG